MQVAHLAIGYGIRHRVPRSLFFAAAEIHLLGIFALKATGVNPVPY